MTMRELLDVEKNTIQNQIKKFEDKVRDMEKSIELIDKYLSVIHPYEKELVEMDLRHKLEKRIIDKREITLEITNIQANILIMQEQLLKGVEVKNEGNK